MTSRFASFYKTLHLLSITTMLLLMWIATPLHAETWQTLAPGLELGRFVFPGALTTSDSTIVVVRIDSKHWALQAHSISEEGLEEGMSSRDWAEFKGMSVVINAGLYDTDRKTHVGMMITPRHENNGNHHSSYKAVLAFEPLKKNVPPWKTYDLDLYEMKKIRKHYGTLLQNLRLIKRPSENRWKPGGKSWWSEAALGEDSQGRLLLIYTPNVVTMYDFNEALLQLPLHLETAQHLEGGLQAQLFIQVGDQKIEFHTGHETDFGRHPDAGPGLAIPNVLGIVKR